MNKKIIAILSLAIMAIICMSAVSATSDGKQATVSGVDFNVPSGFVADKDLDIDAKMDINDYTMKMTGKGYTKNMSAFMVLVTEYSGMDIPDSILDTLSGDMKKINGVTGLQDYNGTYTTFTYLKNGKLVIVSASDDSLLGKIVTK